MQTSVLWSDGVEDSIPGAVPSARCNLGPGFAAQPYCPWKKNQPASLGSASHPICLQDWREERPPSKEEVVLDRGGKPESLETGAAVAVHGRGSALAFWLCCAVRCRHYFTLERVLAQVRSKVRTIVDGVSCN